MRSVEPEIVIADRQLQFCGIKELRLKQHVESIDSADLLTAGADAVSGVCWLEGTIDPPFPEHRDNVMIYHPRIKGIFRVWPDGRIKSNGRYELAEASKEAT